MRFLSEGKNLLLGGESGTGKSHFAKALALLACMDSRRVRYTTSADMLADLNARLADNTLEEALKPMYGPICCSLMRSAKPVETAKYPIKTPKLLAFTTFR